MKNKNTKLAVLSLLILCLEVPPVFGFNDLTEEDFALLPPFCRIWYIEKGRSMESRREIMKKFGAPFSLQHLCPGLKYLNDALKQVDKKKQGHSLSLAADELGYVIRRDGHFPLRPVVLRKLGLVNWLKGDINKALADYEGAIKLKPKYIEVYGDLFDIYIKLGKKEEAEKWLNRGLKVRSDYKPLLIRQKKLKN